MPLAHTAIPAVDATRAITSGDGAMLVATPTAAAVVRRRRHPQSRRREGTRASGRRRWRHGSVPGGSVFARERVGWDPRRCTPNGHTLHTQRHVDMHAHSQPDTDRSIERYTRAHTYTCASDGLQRQSHHAKHWFTCTSTENLRPTDGPDHTQSHLHRQIA